MLLFEFSLTNISVFILKIILLLIGLGILIYITFPLENSLKEDNKPHVK